MLPFLLSIWANYSFQIKYEPLTKMRKIIEEMKITYVIKKLKFEKDKD